MAFSVVLQKAFLLALLSLRAYQNEVFDEPIQLVPEVQNVSTSSKPQQVNLQWTVPNLAHHQELKMMLQIEISRIKTSNVIQVVNYTTTVKWNQVMHWNWKPDIPLECVKYFLRIRGMVDDDKFLLQSSWSNWSSWQEAHIPVSLEPNTVLVFPEDPLVEEGSNITICSVYGRNQHNVSCYLQEKPIPGEQLDSHVSIFNLNNVVFFRDTGTNFFCNSIDTKLEDGIVLFVSKVLEEPKNFSCETQDFKTLNCIWEPGVDTALAWKQQPPQNYTLFESFSGRRKLCNKSSCDWQITDDSQEIYNFTLIAKNYLRTRSVSVSFHLTHRVYLKAPHNVSLEIINTTKAHMTWKVHSRGNDYTLLCQIELLCEKEVIHEHNVSVHMSGDYLFNDLDPDTEYKASVRCADATHFWKWSNWAEKTFSTPEAAPSEALDVWRIVRSKNGSRIVTLFWKPLSKSRANGKILFYNIVAENQDKPAKSKHCSIPAPASDTQLTLDQSSYKLHITANNSVGMSPETILVLSRESGNQEVVEKRINGTKDGFLISWEPRSRDVISYIVDWCAHSQNQLCDLQWKNLGPNTTSTIISSDAFKPGVRYNFRIFEIPVQGPVYLVEKQTGYTQELAPLESPEVLTSNLTSHSFTLSWQGYASQFQAGFIQGYRVYLKSKEMHCHSGWDKVLLSDNSVCCNYDIKDPKQKIFTVENLRPESDYEFSVRSYTSVGENQNATFMMVTTPDEHSHMLLKTMLPMSLCVLLIMVVCYWKSQWVKETCYPDIPNPSKSSILSPIKYMQNPHLTIMNVKDCIPDVLEVINKAEGTKTLYTGAGKLHAENVTKLPPVPTEKDSCGPVPCIFFENFTYDQLAFDSDSHGHVPGPLKDILCQLGPLTPPKNLLNVLGNSNMKSLTGSPTEETSLIYVSQLASPTCGDKDSLTTNLPRPVHCSEYKMQMAVPPSLASPALSKNSDLSSMILLGKGEP
ncbi:oncostatin-M-specific receptor subunit beta isoform X1 [Nannospalax galili]|nr:oncostatin-M-specific receptor subunit beta isoform X1 [Nannospalax galili]XP_017655838.1 oncostatin-M-specific receptor subunit beta isoform X1 [Nannospalax galili]XP_029423650.1 oncostatin-M-specific receptor subunit beta isoform X1 [Nannospalax galili]XP_029423651.1 oncostatin-M-specific receptor subunit beta isoform X1 [Nannospalax galili]XP_029423652.1 oncostatin-M-specific receptor subunit beta isoform X1 [Nannospalax galili]XP_029423653.1 oncostatin-M-specific receptor subunit beta i